MGDNMTSGEFTVLVGLGGMFTFAGVIGIIGVKATEAIDFWKGVVAKYEGLVNSNIATIKTQLLQIKNLKQENARLLLENARLLNPPSEASQEEKPADALQVVTNTNYLELYDRMNRRPVQRDIPAVPANDAKTQHARRNSF